MEIRLLAPTHRKRTTASADAGSVRKKACEIVAHRLRNMIIRGELEEGAALPAENVLIKTLGVSRPTIREAVRILESEGLVTVMRGFYGGAIVNRPDIGTAARHFGFVLQNNNITLIDLYKTRMLVEPPAARITAENSTDDAISELRECIARGWESFSQDLAFGDASAAFHQKLVELTGIQTLILLTKLLDSLMRRYVSSIVDNAGRHLDNSSAKRKVLKAEEKLVELIAKRDGPGAEAYWRQHLNIAERTARHWQPMENVIDLLEPAGLVKLRGTSKRAQ